MQHAEYEPPDEEKLCSGCGCPMKGCQCHFDPPDEPGDVTANRKYLDLIGELAILSKDGPVSISFLADGWQVETSSGETFNGPELLTLIQNIAKQSTP